MDVLPPPDCPPINPSEYPQIPARTPSATLEEMHDLCIRGDIQKFRDLVDLSSSSSEHFDICDCYAIMIEAIKRIHTLFIEELLGRGLPMDPLYALKAIEMKGKDALAIFLEYGWDINQPVSELKPPVLG